MQTGKFYEDKAVDYLQSNGYKIYKRNFRCRFGEIDIIAKNDKYVCFIEVKARNYDYLVSGLEAVDCRKIVKIKKTALFYTANKPDEFYRFDVLEIIRNKDYWQYNLIKGAFDFSD